MENLNINLIEIIKTIRQDNLKIMKESDKLNPELKEWLKKLSKKFRQDLSKKEDSSTLQIHSNISLSTIDNEILENSYNKNNNILTSKDIKETYAPDDKLNIPIKSKQISILQDHPENMITSDISIITPNN